jgi:A/G-specific adenine glycosylase
VQAPKGGARSAPRGARSEPQANGVTTAGLGAAGRLRARRTSVGLQGAARRGRVRAALLRWYRRTRRDLPWRRTRDPWAIWVSETMLQQTRVETVIPYYERFLARFPTVDALADADPDELMRHWAGLGYYSRARNLQAAARRVAREHGGRVPDDVEALRALPGVGRYTAGALASIAFDRPAAIVDGNVARVLARLLDLGLDVRSPAGQRALWSEAEALAAGPAPGELNQALMELGALVCTPRAPACARCPVAPRCAGLAAGRAEKLPVKAAKAAPRAVEGVAAWLVRGPRALAVRRPPRGLLGGLWELPGGELAAGERPADGLARLLRERVGFTPSSATLLGVVTHGFTHRALRLHVFRADADGARVRRAEFDAHRWLAPAAFARLPLSAVAKKALALADGG